MIRVFENLANPALILLLYGGPGMTEIIFSVTSMRCRAPAKGGRGP